MQTLGNWILLPENRTAFQAAKRVLRCAETGRASRGLNPWFVTGPAGSGKTYLTSELVVDLTRQFPDRFVAVLPAADLLGRGHEEDAPDLHRADLIVLEDVQQLPDRSAVNLASLVDDCLGRQRQLILTATRGPAQLTHLPARLTSRLGQGLITVLETLGPESRLKFLQIRGERLGLSVDPTVLAWLADHTPGSPRQLEGALTRLAGLRVSLGRAVDLNDLATAFHEDAEASVPSLERILQRVGRYFQVEPGELCSCRRSREVLVPRQVGMYLARRLTTLSLEQIGAYFGGRDHSTVLHACRKVEQALTHDARLSGAVRQLHADLA